jgi:hypothetical protein
MIKTLDELLSEIKRIAETYGYYMDEEDTKIEEVSIHEPYYSGKYLETNRKPDVGLTHIPDLAVLGDWTNERLVIPVQIVEKLVKELQSIDQKVKVNPKEK